MKLPGFPPRRFALTTLPAMSVLCVCSTNELRGDDVRGTPTATTPQADPTTLIP